MVDGQDQSARLADLVERLIRETGRLRRDVEQVAARLPGGEKTAPDAPIGSELRPPRTLQDLIDRMGVARRSITDSERHLNAIRALLRDIVENEGSRADFQRYIKAPPGGPISG